MAEETPYRLLDAGERALVVEFGSTVDPAINGQVLALDAAFVAAGIAGVRETVPTYRSLMIHYDPLVIPRENLVARVAQFEAAHPVAPKPGARWTFPCCYDPEIAEDIAELAALVKLDVADVARIHANGAYRAYMYGFARAIAISAACRRNSPSRAAPPCARRRPRTPCSSAAACRWWRPSPCPRAGTSRAARPSACSLRIANGRSSRSDVGDELRFAPIDAQTFAALESRAKTGETIARREALA